MGTAVGFLAGLVPGLHMNNIAALVTAYYGSALALFGVFSEPLVQGNAGLLVSCFIASALMSHQFSEAIASTYLGIPAEDAISVLPAHMLSRAGLGRTAVLASAEGSLAGVVLSVILFAPVCILMGAPVFLYDVISQFMGVLVLSLSIALVASEGRTVPRNASSRSARFRSMALGLLLFLAAGALGTIVLKSNFYACVIPDVPWRDIGYVGRSALLLPLFAGLFGVPTLLFSLGQRRSVRPTMNATDEVPYQSGAADKAIAFLGGVMVGWLPGMTPGCATALCLRNTGETAVDCSIKDASRFVWLYSAITSCGAVFAVGAFFVISRERSGSMEAISQFLPFEDGPSVDTLLGPAVALLLSILLAALLSYSLLVRFGRFIERHRDFMSSKKVAIACLALICSLSVALTGTRGSLVLMCAVCLGLLAPLLRVRRILLMGSLLVPIMLSYFLE